MIGQKLSHYRVTAKLGAGGMGEVFRATDDNLGREVAIKVLPSEVRQDPERLARFRREAHLLASLSHPNIAGIHGLEEADGQPFLVLELIEGETLSERLKLGPVPVEEAIGIAKQIAEALEEAHEHGIVHRDLKPANIKLAQDDKVKVLDFGLAKALTRDEEAGSTPDLTQSPTMSAHATQAGVVLGTAAYMSPEQARGKPVDERADIWAFGCVLYEMLTGRPPFEGSDVAELLSAVIRLEPDWTRLPPGTPVGLRRLLERALRKPARSRLRDIGDARNELEELLLAPETGEGSPGAPERRRAFSTFLPWLVAAGLAASLAGGLMRPSNDISDIPVRRFSVDIPSDAAPNWTDFTAALSPDGTHFAYNCRDGNQVDVCVRSMDSLTARVLAEARDVKDIFFSPDAEWVAFYDRRQLAKVSVHGGQSQKIFENTPGEAAPFSEVRGFSWGGDGNILFGTDTGLYRVAAAGGAPERLTRPEAGGAPLACGYPHPLPDGDRALLTVWPEGKPPHAALVDLADGRVRELPLRGVGFVYSPSGHIVFKQGTTVLAAAFDPQKLERLGEALPVLEDVRWPPQLAADGTLLYIPTRGTSSARLVWVDREGRATPVAGERRNYSHLDLSPDGNWALLNIDPDIYVRDLERGTRRLLAEGGFPVWSTDGKRVTYAADTLAWQPMDGSGEAEVLVNSEEWFVPTSWNSKTGDLAYYSHETFDLWMRPPDGEPFVFLGGPGRKRSGRFSPDGEWLAYVNDDTGEYQVYVTAYPGPGPKIPVSVDGGLSPIWSRDGSELFFRKGGKVIAAAVRYEDGIDFGTPVELFDGPFTLDLMGHQRYDVSPDGQSFLMVENSDDFPIIVVQNWRKELARLVPGPL